MPGLVKIQHAAIEIVDHAMQHGIAALEQPVGEAFDDDLEPRRRVGQRGCAEAGHGIGDGIAGGVASGRRQDDHPALQRKHAAGAGGAEAAQGGHGEAAAQIGRPGGDDHAAGTQLTQEAERRLALILQQQIDGGGRVLRHGLGQKDAPRLGEVLG